MNFGWQALPEANVLCGRTSIIVTMIANITRPNKLLLTRNHKNHGRITRRFKDVFFLQVLLYRLADWLER